MTRDSSNDTVSRVAMKLSHELGAAIAEMMHKDVQLENAHAALKAADQEISSLKEALEMANAGQKEPAAES